MDGSCLYSISEENERRAARQCEGLVFGEVQLTLQPLECAGKACGVSQCRKPLSDLRAQFFLLTTVVSIRH